VKWLGTWAVNAALAALALAVYLGFRHQVPAGTGPLVLAMAAAQQAFVLARAWLRVALLGSEMALVERLRPLPVPAPVAADEPQTPSDPGPVSAPEPPLA
jgi:hypothetical protein